MFTGRPTGMRILQFTVVSPGWLIYNICTFSIGGILCAVVWLILDGGRGDSGEPEKK